MVHCQWLLPIQDNVQESSTNQKRNLSSVSAIYDPLGFLAPVILQGRQILQDICKQQLDWDTPSTGIISVGKLGRASFSNSRHWKCTDAISPDEFGEVKSAQLHHFCDASTVGYGQCSYLRLVDLNVKVHCSLVMAKSRVAPVKQVTIPRLELSAAVLSVKISNFLRRELKYKDVEEYFWTDSTVVLGYIK